MKPGTIPAITNFAKRFLLHAVIVWVVVNVWSWLQYNYQVKFDLAYTVNKNGTLLSFPDRFINANINQPLIPWILLVAFLAEINYALVFQWKSLVWFMVSSILLGIAGSTISLLFTTRLPFYPVAAQITEAALFIMVYLAGYAILFNFLYERYRLSKSGQKKSESELSLLKAQINPHFFFNTLNNIYGMALKENAGETAAAIELLSAMMRYTMNGVSEDVVPLATELDFIENYLALQQLRIPEQANITIHVEIDRHEGNLYIVPMLLIPLIENAWKYGISMDHPCYINLKIQVESHQLTMVVENSVFPVGGVDKRSGIGISNVRQRLQLLYPGQHEFLLERDIEKYRAMLSITL